MNCLVIAVHFSISSISTACHKECIKMLSRVHNYYNSNVLYIPDSHGEMMPGPSSGCGQTLALVTGHPERKTAPDDQPYPGHLGELYPKQRKQ